MSTEQERAEFEAWTGYSEEALSRSEGDGYCIKGVDNEWRAYQAGRAALQSQDREDSARLDFIEKEWFYRDSEGCWAFNFNESWDAGSHESLREAIDSARRVEGESQ